MTNLIYPNVQRTLTFLSLISKPNLQQCFAKNMSLARKNVIKGHEARKDVRSRKYKTMQYFLKCIFELMYVEEGG